MTLKDGIDLLKLRSGAGAEFELDPSAPLPGGADQEDSNKAFDREEVFQQLNFECLGLGRDGEDDSESEVKPAPNTADTLYIIHIQARVCVLSVHINTPNVALIHEYIISLHSLTQSESPFQRLATQMEDLSGDGGVLKRHLHPGVGRRDYTN